MRGRAEPAEVAAPTETQRLLSCQSRRGQGGHVGRAWQTKLFSSLTQQEMGTHTFTLANCEDRAAVWFLPPPKELERQKDE